MKKGFTLIEVIAVIVILGIIGLIAVPVSNSIVKRSKEKLYNEQVERIIDACKKYVLENDSALPDEVENQTKSVSIETIYNAGLLEGEIPNNPKTNEPMNGHVEITYSNNRYTYRFVEDS